MLLKKECIAVLSRPTFEFHDGFVISIARGVIIL